jgi:hypothetical protein
MEAFKINLDFLLEGREEALSVTADQRDFAAWEAQPEAENERAWVHTRFRFLTWHAAKRQGVIAMSWAEFNEKLCIQVHSRDQDEAEQDAEDEQEPDPSVA